MSATRPATEFSIGIMPSVGVAAADRGEGVLEGRARHRLVVRIDLARREVRIRARLALEDDLLGGRHDRSGTHADVQVNGSSCSRQADVAVLNVAMPQDRARPLQVLGRVDAERHAVDDRHVDAHAGFQRAQLLEPLALFERRGRQADEPLERGAAIGIEADVVVERPVARTARWRG